MFALLAAAVLTFASEDAESALRFADALVRNHTPRAAGTVEGLRAAEFIASTLERRCVAVRRDVFFDTTPEGRRTFFNVYADFISVTNGDWIVLLSHFDTKKSSDCPGANDGASTSGLLISLAEVLSRSPGACGNVMLVWTDGEESLRSYTENDGLHGARRVVREIRRLGRDVRAAICLDMLGDKDLNIMIPANSSARLASKVRYAACQLGYRDLVSLSDKSMTDDHVSFLNQGWPAVDLIDFSYGPYNSYWHSPDDTVDKLSVESLFKVGRLVTELLKLL